MALHGLWAEDVGKQTQCWAELGPPEHMNKVTQWPEPQKIRRTLPIQLFGLSQEFHATNGDSKENSSPATEHTQPRELFKSHKKPLWSSSWEFWVWFEAFFSFLLDISIWLSAKIRVPSEDLVFQLNSKVKPELLQWTPWAAGVVLQLLGGCGTLTPHPCCTETDLKDPKICLTQKLLLFRCWLSGQKGPEVRILTQKLLYFPAWVSLHWDWAHGQPQRLPQGPTNLPNRQIIIIVNIIIIIQMPPKWLGRSWHQDHTMGIPLHYFPTSWNLPALRLTSWTTHPKVLSQGPQHLTNYYFSDAG